MTKLDQITKFLKENNINLGKLISPSIGKVVVLIGVSNLFIPFIELIIIAILKNFDIHIQQSNNPFIALIVIVIGFLFEAYVIKQNNKIQKEILELKSNEALFNEFKISKALQHLDELLNSDNIKDKYKLYVLKADYYLKLQRIEDFKKIMSYIEKTYKEQSINDNKKFKPLKLTLLSLDNQEKSFFELANEISINQNRPIEYYKLIYYVNSFDNEKILEVLKGDEYNKIKVKPDMTLILCHAHYIATINNQSEFTYFNEQMMSFYDKYVEEQETKNRFEYLSIHLNKSLIEKIKVFQQFQSTSNENDLIFNTNKLIESILPELENFGEKYKEQIINTLATNYKIINDIESFKSLFEKYKSLLNEEQYIFYYFNTDKKISSDEIFEIYNSKNFINFLAVYIEYLYRKKEKNTLLTFIESKKLLSIGNDNINCFYDLTRVDKNVDVKDIHNKYASTKESDILHSIIYLKSSKKLDNPIDKEFLNTLEKHLIDSQNLIHYFVEILIKLLFRLDYIYTYSLSLKISCKYPTIIDLVIELSSKNKNIYLNEFENFINTIDYKTVSNKYKYNILVGNVYNSFFHMYKAYQYYVEAWKEYNDVELAKKILDTIIRMKSLNIVVEDKNTFSLIYSYLKANGKFSDIETALIGSYYHFQNEEYNDGVILFNEQLLSLNFDTLEKDQIDLIGSLYFKSIMDVKDETIFDSIDENILLLVEGIYYINKVYEKIIDNSFKEKYNVQFENTIKLKAMIANNIEVKSLFHFITNKLIHKASTVQMIETNIGQENQFQEIFDMVKSAAEHDQNMLDYHMSGEFMPLYQLSKQRYENFAPLMINELLYNEKHKFITGNNNPNKNAKKLISISSLLLLKYLGHLEAVLSLENVYIQSTVLNWIEFTKESLKNDKTQMSMSYKDGNFYKEEMTEEKRNGLVEVYEELYQLILKHTVSNDKIVNDYNYSLPYKIDFTIINFIGHLDFYAMGYCIGNNFQLITEDISLTKIYETSRFNPLYISNMMPLIAETIDINKFIDLAYDLHKLGYLNTLNENSLDYITKLAYDKNTQTLLDNNLKNIVGKTLQILDDYKLLEDLKLKYKQQYMIQDIKGKSLLLKNLDYLFTLKEQIIEFNKEED